MANTSQWFMGAFVFYKSEKNQKWTYFECLYFAYTSLLTVGYGDFQPESNSGKPFFVFWSLLAIPTLTILISNMGDTVVKGVKDATIWLGEVTVLPNDNDSMLERLKYGIERLTLGMLDPEKVSNMKKKPQQMKRRNSAASDSNSFQELHPGLAKVLGRRGRKKLKQRQQDMGERMASDFEAEEKLAEDEARDRGDKIAEDEHAYRRMLLSNIRQVYADSSGDAVKKYTYDEWAFFLKLLGEDEADERYHLRAMKSRTAVRHRRGRKDELIEDGREGQSSIVNPHQTGDPDIDEPMKWSWIGPRSPLMGDKDEPEWLLVKLFERLEDSMRISPDEREQRLRTQKDVPSDQDTIQEGGDESSGKETKTDYNEKV